MGKLGKIIIMVGLLSVFALSSVALAQSYEYDDTIPFFGHKTLTEGRKENTLNYAVNTTYDCESAFYVWIDCKINNSWTKCAGDYICYANKTVSFVYDDAVPSKDSQVRLRTKLYKTNSGQRVVGKIEF